MNRFCSALASVFRRHYPRPPGGAAADYVSICFALSLANKYPYFNEITHDEYGRPPPRNIVLSDFSNTLFVLQAMFTTRMGHKH